MCSSATATSTTIRSSTGRVGSKSCISALKIRLRQLLGEELVVWRDPKLSGNEPFEDTLRERLLKTALLLSVVSPRYVKSESCLKELEAFCQGAAQSGGLRVEDKARLPQSGQDVGASRDVALAAAAVPRRRILRPWTRPTSRAPIAAGARRRAGVPAKDRRPRLRHQGERWRRCAPAKCRRRKRTRKAAASSTSPTPSPRSARTATSCGVNRAARPDSSFHARQHRTTRPVPRVAAAGQLQRASVSCISGELYGATLEGESRSNQ